MDDCLKMHRGLQHGLLESPQKRARSLRATLVAYYTDCGPESLGKVDRIARKYRHNKATPFALLEEKYGAKVVPIATERTKDEL